MAQVLDETVLESPSIHELFPPILDILTLPVFVNSADINTKQKNFQTLTSGLQQLATEWSTRPATRNQRYSSLLFKDRADLAVEITAKQHK
ncbi:hypothetical protein KIN20_002815 [Parelaphostrongylus tenuis]|uniref:Uncharacterized protein n=1 Tax=Parelaphostrongylus tenuis TaxID=148309 RepID=A0AAD5M0C9_PARTN|nr:hypothetical protein KIN20_002815 [Parelaphostrongylus tenuis]